MIHPHRLPLVAAAVVGAALSLSSCASDESSSSTERSGRTRHQDQAANHDDDDDRDDDEARKHPPRIGMTKAEVRSRYGEPSSVNETGHGETWIYNTHGLSGSDFAPFYGGIHQLTKSHRGGSINFAPDGRVRDYNWNSD